jgi:hypothetical protein
MSTKVNQFSFFLYREEKRSHTGPNAWILDDKSAFMQILAFVVKSKQAHFSCKVCVVGVTAVGKSLPPVTTSMRQTVVLTS